MALILCKYLLLNISKVMYQSKNLTKLYFYQILFSIIRYIFLTVNLLSSFWRVYMLLLEENSTQKCSTDKYFISTMRRSWSGVLLQCPVLSWTLVLQKCVGVHSSKLQYLIFMPDVLDNLRKAWLNPYSYKYCEIVTN